MSLVEFLGYGAVGANLGQAYIVGIAAIIVLEDGTAQEIMQLPAHLVKMFRKIK